MSSDTLSNKAKATRERILDAAVKLFSSKGYHETRVDEIVDASGTSKGSVYFHFPGKQQMFLALVDKFADLLEKRLIAVLEREEDGVHRVNRALEICLETFAEYRGLAKILLIQAVGLGAAFEEKRLELHDRFARLVKQQLDEAVAAGQIPPIDTEVVAYAWMGAINEVVIRWVYTGQPAPERLLPTLRTMLLRSIGLPKQQIQALKPTSEQS